MKIALYHNLPIGGAQQVMYEQVKRLSQRGHAIFEYSFSTVDDKLRDVKPYLEHSLRLPLNSPKELEKVSKSLAEEVNNSGVDVIFAHQDMFTQVPPGLEYFKLPSVYSCQEPKRTIFEPYLFNELIKRGDIVKKPFVPEKLFLHRLYEQVLKEQELAKKAQVVLANSLFSRESIYRAYGVFALVNYPGIDSSIYYPRNVKREKAVLHIGTSIHKNPEWSIDIVSKLAEPERPELWFRSTPSQKDLDYLTTYAKERKVKVKFIPELNPDEMAQLYSCAKCFLSPYTMEPFGLTPLEALACGTPVIGFNEGGLRETIIHGKTGYLLERDQDAWAKTLTKVLKEDSAHYSKCNSNYVEKEWSWEKSIVQLEEILNQTKEKYG